MSKRHTLGVSKWLPSTEDKITFRITLRPSTPNISKHLCICVYVFVCMYLCICIYVFVVIAKQLSRLTPSQLFVSNVCGRLPNYPSSNGQTL